ncbi:TolC family protein [Nitratifractor sp.]
MKRWIIAMAVSAGLPLAAAMLNYKETIRSILSSPTLQSARSMEAAAREMEAAARGVLWPTLDARLSAVRLRERPTMTLRLPFLPVPSTEPVGKRNRFEGELALRYPLFSGFAISAAIDEARFKALQARLKVLDIERNLILQASTLYSTVRGLDAVIDALQKARRAAAAAVKKAEGMYRNGLLAPADLYAVRARLYAVDADLAKTRSRRRQLLNSLSYLAGRRIDGCRGGIPVRGKLALRTLIGRAYRNRADTRMLRAALGIDEARIRQAKSRFYPHVGLEAVLKRQGDTLALDGDGYSNADRSYVGVGVEWNLFSGGADRHRLEAARLRKMARFSQLEDYRRRVATEIANARLDLDALYARLHSARMQERSAESYYRLVRGRFANKLASGDELSRAIADLAAARAEVASVRAGIEVQRAKVLLLGGVEDFKVKLGISRGRR